jgi:hypothetical protein
MEKKRNPLKRTGNRNVLCAFYDECLDDAIERSWRDWDCDECQHKLNHNNPPDVLLMLTESMGY